MTSPNPPIEGERGRGWPYGVQPQTESPNTLSIGQPGRSAIMDRALWEDELGCGSLDLGDDERHERGET